jgi:hypothetical protein
MPVPSLPAHVAPGELITSAWGNQVVTVQELTDSTYELPIGAQTVGPGSQAPIANQSLGTGIWLVVYQVLMSSTGELKCTLRMFMGGSLYTDSTYRLPGPSAAMTGHIMGIADFSGGGAAVTVNLINNSATDNVSVFADASNHRLFVMQGRKP